MENGEPEEIFGHEAEAESGAEEWEQLTLF